MSATPPFNALRFAEPLVSTTHDHSGQIILRSAHALSAYPNHFCFHLRRWAKETPERVFLAERSGETWDELTYYETLKRVEALGQFVLQQKLSANRPLMVLSENRIDVALITLAGLYVGVPVIPVSPAYSLLSNDLLKLRKIAEHVTPGMIFAREGERYARAIDAIRTPDTKVVVTQGDVPGAIRLQEAQSTLITAAVGEAFEQVKPDSIAKILFTSGSTGDPKGVITTHRMLCSNQQSVAQCWPFLEDAPPVILDWLPWSHAFGANHNFNLILRNGGTLYIDDGKPVPELIQNTVRNLREVSPTLYFNAPRGFDMLLPYLEQDAALRDNFFRRLQFIFYAGADLPQSLWERLERVSIQSRGERVRMVSSWGTTETTCTATSVYYTIERAGVIGLPVPGVEIKLSPVEHGMEIRVRGPIVTPGYWKQPDLALQAFDEDGFYKTGDSANLADPADPTKGIVFDGRVAEDFKLLSGTWVQCGQVRLGVIAACSPAIQDAVVTGHDRESLGLLIFLNQTAARTIVGDHQLDLEALSQHPKVLEHIRTGLQAYNHANDANSMRIERYVLLSDLPSIDKGEITDKGYINQRVSAQNRKAWIEALYGTQPQPGIHWVEQSVGLSRGDATVNV